MTVKTTNHKAKRLKVLKLALPAVAENVSQVLLGLGDTFFVSLVGASAIAAVGLTNLYMNLFLAVITAFTVGTVALVAKATGEKNRAKAHRVSVDSFYGVLAVGALFMLFTWLGGGRLLGFAGASPQVIAAGSGYMAIIGFSALFAGVSLVTGASLRARGDTVSPMIVGIAMNVINLSLDWLFVVVLDYGVVGAGVATAIARVVGALWLMAMYRSHVDMSAGFHFDVQSAKDIFRIGVPAGIEKLFFRTGQLFYGSLIVSIGTATYAAHNIAGSVEALSYLPAMGFGVAAATLVGQSLGEKDEAKAKAFGWTAWRISTLVMMAIAALFAITVPYWAAIFTQDPAIQSDVVRVIRLIALFQPFLAATMVTTAALQGAGDTRFPMILTLIGTWGIRVGGTYIMGIQLGWGLFGVWMSYAIDITFRGTLLMWRFQNAKWLKQKPATSATMVEKTEEEVSSS